MEQKQAMYEDPESELRFTREGLRSAEPDVQKRVMRHWFYANYEDPAQRTPYEGGYIYIWGGPYHAKDELEAEFCEYVSADVIDDLVGELAGECSEWAPVPQESDYDDYYFDAIESTSKWRKKFLESTKRLSQLLQLRVRGHLQEHLIRLIYVSVVTALEAYLSEAFVNMLFAKRHCVRRFVERNSELANRGLTLGSIFTRSEKLNEEIREYLSSKTWHNLKRTQDFYREAFGIEFPRLQVLPGAILIRHDIVHRDGRSKSGKRIRLTKTDVKSLIDEAKALVEHIDTEVRRVKRGRIKA